MTDRNTMTISFPGGLKVAADFQGHHLVTDQPKEDGGDGSGPEPFVLFLASIGACAGYYVLKFCSARDLPMEGVGVTQRMIRDPETNKLEKIALDIEVPASFPEKYRGALLRAASQCAVKKAIERPVPIETQTVVV